MSARGYTNGHGVSVEYPGGEMPDALRKARSSSLEPYEPEPLVTSSGLHLIINDDGSVDFEPPTPSIQRRPSEDNFSANLAETLPSSVLSAIAHDYIDGVNTDIASRQQFIANYNKGIDLLGLKIEEASGTRGSRQSISRVKNPALLKACVKSQSMARGQLLPAEGPAKIQTISGNTGESDTLARDFTQDFNYYLTEVDKPFYPDSDRMLFYRAFGGTAFKKVYRDTILGRPVSRFISLDSLIVSEDATDLDSALRKTNELLYTPVDVKRMMVMGGWLDIPLATPMPADSAAKRKINEVQGIASVSTRSQDQQHTIYEGYWSIDPKDYGFDEPDAPSGLPLPYKVVIDRDSQQILALHRNWKKDDEEFKERQVFVKYGLVPGLGFLDYGFLHLVGNQTRVLTAMWQIMIDRGMLSNFPGGLRVKGVRTATNEITPGVGEWAEVEIGNMEDIRKAFMPMPYGDIGPNFIELLKIVQDDVEALAGTLDIHSGEAAKDIPVASILAQIEQQTQDLTAVHQRDHRAQKEELCLLRDLFAENPGDLRWLKRKGSTRQWGKMVAEFQDMDLVPASDPNVPSQMHRVMLNQYLMELAGKAPMLFGPLGLRKVAKRSLESVGINDAEDLLDSPQNIMKAMAQQAQAGKGGNGGSGQVSLLKTQMELPLKQAELQLEAQRIQQEGQTNQRQAANEAADAQERTAARQGKEQLTASELELERNKIAAELTHEQTMAAAENQLDPLDQAKLDQTKAATFAAMGSGAASFAKAGQTVQQGEDETPGEPGTGQPSEPKLQRPSRQRKKQQSTEGQ